MTPAARRTVRTGVAALGLALVAAPLATAPTASASGNGLVVSEVYGGGGNSGAPLRNDFIELHNTGSAAVDLTGWSVQYASSTGGSWQLTPISGTLAPGGYYLVQEGAGAGGASPLPTPDATGSIAMSAANGKVALVTGGGSGIGLMIVQALAVNGAKVYITGRTQEKLDRVVESHGKNISGQIIPLTADISDKNSIRSLYEE